MCNSYHISCFVCWSVVTGGCVFSAVLLNSCQKNNNGRLLLQIDNIDLTQQFSLSIFTDFCYQSINITWLLLIFIDWLLRASSDLQLYVVDRTIWLLYNTGPEDSGDVFKRTFSLLFLLQDISMAYSAVIETKNNKCMTTCFKRNV